MRRSLRSLRDGFHRISVLLLLPEPALVHRHHQGTRRCMLDWSVWIECWMPVYLDLPIPPVWVEGDPEDDDDEEEEEEDE